MVEIELAVRLVCYTLFAITPALVVSCIVLRSRIERAETQLFHSRLRTGSGWHWESRIASTNSRLRITRRCAVIAFFATLSLYWFYNTVLGFGFMR